MMRILCVVLFAVTSVVFGQLDSNSITVTASRSMYVQADQVVFSISVSAPINATLDDIVAALQGSGITADTLSASSANLSFDAGGQTLWLFTLPAPLANMQSTVTRLTMLQQAIAKTNAGLKLGFSVQGSQVSPQVRDSQCMIPDLVSDARTQAQKLATAAGVTLGPILAIANGQPGGGSAGSFVFNTPTLAQRTGGFSFAGLTFGVGLTGLPRPLIAASPAVTCSVTVKFALLRYQ